MAGEAEEAEVAGWVNRKLVSKPLNPRKKKSGGRSSGRFRGRAKPGSGDVRPAPYTG